MAISELESYFNSIDLPVGPIYLNPSAKINDVRHFLNSNFEPLKSQGETFINIPLKGRLVELKNVLEKMEA